VSSRASLSILAEQTLTVKLAERALIVDMQQARVHVRIQ
jgi:hypothetical protein